MFIGDSALRANGDTAKALAHKGELLLELLSEEIPARMQRAALDDLCALLRDKLAAAEIPAERLEGYVTPRRLTVIAEGIPARQPDRREERRGPRVGAPQSALDGFLRAAGLATLADCEIRDSGRGEFYFAIIDKPGRAAAEVLSELIRSAMIELPWPKSMRFPAAPLRWVRPLTSILCLFDGAVVPLDLGQVPVGRVTRGHRFLAPDAITVGNAAEYCDRLERAYVILDRDRRKSMIRGDLDRLAAAAGIRAKPDPELLDEIAGLVEFPVTLSGAIDPVFMSLPPEVLTAAMRTHQKYFSCLYPDGSAAPHFLCVANILAPDGGKAIIAGNERVLRARLADARFFWEQDRRVPLADRVEALKERVFHAKLGSLYEKAMRAGNLAYELAVRIPGADPQRCVDAMHLAKADLSTGMVGEFPELQGIIGRYYALEDGKDSRIAEAIGDHYKPLGPGDTCPTAPDSIAVALADKIDTLVAFFAIGEKPTGSRDPFALRRAAQGIIRIILENKLRLPLAREFLTIAGNFGVDPHKLTDELLDFIADRLKVHLREQGVRHDLIAAVFALGEDDLVRLCTRVAALSAFLASEDGANLLVAYRRAANIVAIEKKKGGWCDGPVAANLFRQPEEEALYQRLDGISAIIEGHLAHERFDQAMVRLATLRQSVDEFFARVTVNAVESELRENRLRLLSRIRATMNEIADFSQIEG
jgi:glycyl-tRNA synthetase beta chain